MPLFTSQHLFVQYQHGNELTIMKLKNREVFFYGKILNYQSRYQTIKLFCS